MSNKRIDLTQFEDMPKKMETEWNEHAIYGARYLIKICEPETPWVVGAIVPDYLPYDIHAKDMAEQERMAKFFATTPDLITELKRCYEEIDSLQGKINKANYAMQRYCDEWPDLPYPDHRIDNVCDAYEEVCIALD